jgi:hypothetical protein
MVGKGEEIETATTTIQFPVQEYFIVSDELVFHKGIILWGIANNNRNVKKLLTSVKLCTKVQTSLFLFFGFS